MAESENQFEKYLRGEPLNEEMEALKRGLEDPEAEVPSLLRPVFPEQIGEIEREHLRRMVMEPGWGVFLKLVDITTKRQEDAVRAMSLDNPLMNRDKIAAGWAEVGIMQGAWKMMLGLVNSEIQKLEER